MVAGVPRSAHAGPLAALAFHHPVALFQEPLTLAILALLLLLDVRALFIGHVLLHANNSQATMIQPRIPVYKHAPLICGISMITRVCGEDGDRHGRDRRDPRRPQRAAAQGGSTTSGRQRWRALVGPGDACHVAQDLAGPPVVTNRQARERHYC